ncbi:MAG: DNA-binding protein, partial [Polaromonas sp.]|nr:DNA-binding protein [Polaromonas sp.]
WDAMNDKMTAFTQSVTLKRLALDQLAMGIKIERKPGPNRGVFEVPVKQVVRPDVPNSVFALGQTLQVP